MPSKHVSLMSLRIIPNGYQLFYILLLASPLSSCALPLASPASSLAFPLASPAISFAWPLAWPVVSGTDSLTAPATSSVDVSLVSVFLCYQDI